jgi:hypothetical protein
LPEDNGDGQGDPRCGRRTLIEEFVFRRQLLLLATSPGTCEAAQRQRAG